MSNVQSRDEILERIKKSIKLAGKLNFLVREKEDADIADEIVEALIQAEARIDLLVEQTKQQLIQKIRNEVREIPMVSEVRRLGNSGFWETQPTVVKKDILSLPSLQEDK